MLDSQSTSVTQDHPEILSSCYHLLQARHPCLQATQLPVKKEHLLSFDMALSSTNFEQNWWSYVVEKLGPGAVIVAGVVVLLAMVHGRVGRDTLLTGSNFWSELKIENHDIETILLFEAAHSWHAEPGGVQVYPVGSRQPDRYRGKTAENGDRRTGRWFVGLLS